MIDVAWPLFIATSLVIIATPGQDMLMVMSRSLSQGATAGVATAAGVSVGLVGHTLLAALGLGALLQASEWLFTVLKFAGAAYLLYLGIGLLRTRSSEFVLAGRGHRPLARLFLDGALSNITNPKIAIFYFAFLPQFVHPKAASPAASILALGLAFAGLTFAVKGPIGWSTGALSQWLRSRPRALTWLYRSSGAVLIGLGVKRAFERRS